jgi:purine-binding chemotaxis protein CheW
METTDSVQQGVSQNTQELAGKYLTFQLGKEEYGIGILKVKEIIGMMEITAVPQTPSYVKGVINLRGSVIPVLELRTKFGMDTKEYDDRTCIIVTEVQRGTSQIQVGMIVDSVSEVLNVGQEDIEPPPVFGGASVDTANILGMAKMKGEVKILLDVDNVVSEGELEELENI